MLITLLMMVVCFVYGVIGPAMDDRARTKPY
jgi:hypothetical protein